jgi:hypothetical protein
LVVVRSCTCTSSPITGSYFANAAVPTAVAVIFAWKSPLGSASSSFGLASPLAYPDECIVLFRALLGRTPTGLLSQNDPTSPDLPQNVRGGHRFVLITAVRW